MFLHNFKYTFKIIFRNKMLVFWTFAFPIVLGTLFKMAFSNIESSEKLNLIDIAVVDNQSFKDNEILKEAFDTLGDEKDSERIFDIVYVSEDKAEELLESEDISGYLLMDGDEPKIVVKQNGINETIVQYVTEEIIQTGNTVNTLAEEEIAAEIAAGNFSPDYKNIYLSALERVQDNEVSLKDVSNKNLSYTMIEFYTLIAMTCLYGGIIGMCAVNNNLPNMGDKGKRTAVTPVSKGKVLISSLLAGYIIQLIGLSILFVYTIFVLKVDYGDNLALIIVLALAGSLAGLSLGIAVAALIKSNENTKTGVLIGITMFCCFLSGMMGITMKYIVDKNMPFLGKINPAAMITDGFYSLYYYDTYDRYFVNVAALLVFSLVMLLLSVRGLRRQKYDSI